MKVKESYIRGLIDSYDLNLLTWSEVIFTYEMDKEGYGINWDQFLERNENGDK